ncbi:MAG TPA: beta-propeller fold lactonase family protein, partial [Anaerolineales bacterium]|nr:beta-propeller fold lactonase family protein [Anaerolineales bacterium]
MQQHRRLRARIQALSLCLGAISALAAVPLAAQSHHFVYLASATGQTISGFELSPASGTLISIAGPPFNNGRDPGAMTLHPSGRFLYVMNAAAKNVSAFAVNPVTGVLNEVPASPFAVGGGNTPELFLVEPSGKFLYVVSTFEDASETATSISYYAVDQDTGALNPASAGSYSPGYFTPAGFVSKPGDNFLYLAGTANASNSIVSIRTIELDAATGDISNVYPPSGQGQFAHSAAISPNGQFLFVGRGQSAGSIDTYTISATGIPEYLNNNTFSIPGTSPLPYALAVDASGSYLYALVSSVGILGFAVDPGTGALASLGPPFVGPPVSQSAVLVADPVEQFLYYEQRPFAISDQGALDELSTSPLPIAGSVTGIAAANPPLDDVQPISAPQLTLTPSPLLFSDQYVGGFSQTLQVSLSNTGNAPLILSSISIMDANGAEFGLSTGDCLAVLPPGNGCTILITFQPTAEGVRQATLTVVDNALGSPHIVELTGLGLLPFTLQLDSSFGSVVAGQMAQYNLHLEPAPGFAGQVVLACSGAPAG